MAQNYFFITRWQIKAPVEEVWDAIYNSLEWPSWWKGVTDAKEVEKGDERGINGVRELTWRSVLPYELKFLSKAYRKRRLQTLTWYCFW
jgi:hypothetical protein